MSDPENAEEADPPAEGDDAGKVDRAFFESAVRPHLGSERSDVVLGPTYGVDFGVVEVGDRVLVTATDPVSVLPALGWERAGRFAMEICLADVAVSGLPPTHVAVGLHLPPEFSDDALRRTWRGMSDAVADVGAAVVTGHTGRYAGCSLPWVGAATVMAVGDPDDVVRPDGARPGDRLIVTKGPAIETAALLAHLAPDRLAEATGSGTVDRARDLTGRATPVRDALVAAAAGSVTAMHDATERGLANALWETSEAAGVGFAVDRAAVPLDPTVEAVCAAFGIDPWTSASAGTLLVTVEPEGVEGVLAALADEGIEAAAVGQVTAEPGVRVDGEPLGRPERDAFAEVYGSIVDGD